MRTQESLEDSKLQLLAEDYGMSVGELLERFAHDSVVPGICMDAACDHTTEQEPDQRGGWCEACGNTTVKSALVLAEIL